MNGWILDRYWTNLIFWLKFCQNFVHLGTISDIKVNLMPSLWSKICEFDCILDYSRWISHFRIQICLEISLTMASLPHQLIWRRSSDSLIFGVFRSLNPSKQSTVVSWPTTLLQISHMTDYNHTLMLLHNLPRKFASNLLQAFWPD